MKAPKLVLLLACILAPAALAADLVVQLPVSVECKFASALEPSPLSGEDGPAKQAAKIDGATIEFDDLTANIPYDLLLKLADGRTLRGVNMSWYTAEPAQPDAGELNADDRSQIEKLVAVDKSFYDISRILAVRGDHQRATVLVERIRTGSFVGQLPGQMVWRVELWYFTNDFGGWSEIQQSNKVVIRKRCSSDEYHAAADQLVWLPEIGGIRLKDGNIKLKVELPATRP